ncbi:MAG: tetratricopeptide repeat protein [Promethearchaeota archaeon]|nr:MAG: tetratricopeptide repeat protein [Candidatus Lokiarchaeota archaeon]
MNFETQSQLVEIEENIPINPSETEKELRELLEVTSDLKTRSTISSLIGYTLVTQAKFTPAKDIYFEIYDTAIKNNYIELEADALNGLAMIETEFGEFQKAEIHSKNALKIYQNLEMKEKEAKIANLLGVLFFYQHKFDESLKYLNIVPDLLKNQKQNFHIELQTLANLGLVYSAKGELTRAKDIFTKALQMAQDHHYLHWACIIASNLADTEISLGNIREAEILFLKGLKIAHDTKDLRSQALISVGYAHYSIEMGNLTRANDLLSTALDIYKNIDDPIGFISALYRNAQYWMIKGQLIRARDDLNHALHIIENAKLNESLLDILILLAEVEQGLGNTNKAYQFLNNAEEFSRNQEVPLAHAQILILRAKFSMEKGNFNESEFLLKEAEFLAKAHSDYDLHATCHLLLARSYLIQIFNFPEKLHDKNQKYYRDKAIEEVDLVIKLSQEGNLKIVGLQSLIIRGILFAIEGDKEAAITVITQALEASHSIGLIFQEQSAKDTLSLVQAKSDQQNIPLDVDIILFQVVIEKLKYISYSYGDSPISQTDFEDVSLVVFKIDEKVGPMIIEAVNLDVSDPQKQSQILHSGSLISITLGQGQQYHQGLFGPLPFGIDSTYALVFAQTIADQTQKEKRNHGRAYFLFSLVYPKKMNMMFYERSRLNNIFMNQLKNIHEAAEITPAFLNNILKNVTEELMT